MNRQEIIDDIKYIKEVISSSIHYTNLSGIAAVVSGLVAVAGCLASTATLGTWRISEVHLAKYALYLVVIWSAVFLISGAAHVFFIGRKAQKTGQPAWSYVAKVIVYALCPPFLVGACFTAFLVLEHKLMWIPGMWMVCFGLGVWSAGLFSIPEPRWLGVAFMLLGMSTLFFWQPYGVVFMTVSFGLCHVLYGIRIYAKYDRRQ